ncbi:MAG: DUF6636 domain-containing protein [Nocardioidaceae bacterium]
MRVRHLVALLCVTALCVSACASAGDIATTSPSRPGATTPASASKGPTKSQSPSPTPSPTKPTKTPGQRLVLPHTVGAISSFLTPSHNIGCLITNDAVRCDIRKHAYRSPPKPENCNGDYGQSIEVTRSGIGSFICVTDTVIDVRAPVLRYGTSTVVGDFGCTSTEAGIHCYYLKSDVAHGFDLSRENPALY